MKRLLLFLFVPALVGVFALTSDTTYSSAPQSQNEYLALGDSLGYGFGASDPATKGYVPLFREFLESEGGLDTDLPQQPEHTRGHQQFTDHSAVAHGSGGARRPQRR